MSMTRLYSVMWTAGSHHVNVPRLYYNYNSFFAYIDWCIWNSAAVCWVHKGRINLKCQSPPGCLCSVSFIGRMYIPVWHRLHERKPLPQQGPLTRPWLPHCRVGLSNYITEKFSYRTQSLGRDCRANCPAKCNTTSQRGDSTFAKHAGFYSHYQAMF